MFPGYIKECSGDSENRTAFYLSEWKPLNNYSHLKSVNDICPKPRRYQSASKPDTLSHEAVEKTYEGGGYVAELGYNQVSAAKVIEHLLQHNRCLIHLPRYSVKSEMYTKQLPTGQVVTAVDVRSLSLYPSVSAKSSYEVCQLLFLIVMVVYLIPEMVKFFRYKSYLFQIWNWLELVLLVVSVVAVMLSLFKAKETSLDVRRIQSNPYKGSSSDTIAHLLAIEIVWLLIAIFLTTLKLPQLIRFNPHICH